MGVTVLSDEYKRIPPWKDDPAVAKAAEDISRRLDPTWKIDRELLGQPIIIPTETAIISYVPWYLDGRRLLPNSPESPKSSIQEVNVEGSGWMSLDDARALAKGRGYHNLAIPMVAECLVSYQVGEKGFGGTMSISPAEYAFMEKQYLARQQEMELKLNGQPLAARGRGLPSPTDDQPFDNLKREAKERALQKGQSYSARHKPNTHVHSL